MNVRDEDVDETKTEEIGMEAGSDEQKKLDKMFLSSNHSKELTY